MIYFEIFWVFFRISWIAFGGVFGVLPELERLIVTEHGWITHERFIQSYVLSQFVPGPNMAMCPLIGYWVAGWPGWVAGFFGIYLPPLLIIGLAFWLLNRYRESPGLRRFELGLRPVVLGLLVGSALRMWWLQSGGLEGEGSVPRVEWTLRVASLALGSLGVWLYARKRWSSVPLILAMGACWWLVGRAVT